MAPQRKPKTFTTPKKKKQKVVNKPPETADEYLAAGVELEEAGEKWRAGDAAKASRFFVRAIEMYDEGLGLFPTSFDMAYNKARIQYDITQRPKLLAEASAPLPVLLEQALLSHRRAIDLDSRNADVMFNLGQVLTSLADAIDDEQLSIRYLEESLSLFEACYKVQLENLAEAARINATGAGFEAAESGDSDEGGVPLPSTEAEDDMSDGDMQWASIMEPTTQTSLRETCIVALDSVTDLYSLLPTTETDAMANANLYNISKVWMHNLAVNSEGLGDSVEDERSRDDARCALLKCEAASLEARYRFGEISASAYGSDLQAIVDRVGSKIETPVILCVCAELHISFAVATANSPSNAVARWTNLATALEYLGRATRVAEPQNVPKIHADRGDVELFRYSICLEGSLPWQLSNEAVRKTLLKNAGTYYRGAAATAQSIGQTDVHQIATIKGALCESLELGNTGAAGPLSTLKAPGSKVIEVLNQLMTENLVPRSVLSERGIL